MEKNFWQKYSTQILGLVIILLALVSFFFLAEIFLPFILGLLLAYLTNPIIKRIQTVIRKRELAVTVYLIGFFVMFLSIIIFFGAYLVEDTKRLAGAIETFTEEHQEQIDSAEAMVTNFFGEISENETVQEELEKLQDTSSTNSMDLSGALEEVSSALGESSENETGGRSVNWFVVFIMTFAYYFTILFTYPYFESKFQKYFGKNAQPNERLQGIWNDFNNTFLLYFRQRTKVVLICMSIFTITFLLLGLPGAILIGILTGLLCYASHFHYITLLPLVVSCWVVSVEQNQSFFLYFGIVLAVFVIVSILDELVFFPKIMKGVASMNPAITILAFALWIFIFGGIVGTLIALPLTQLLLIYLDRFLLYSKDNPQLIRNKVLKEEE